MIHLLQKLLKELAPAAWRIEETRQESAELFFVKKQLDTRRGKDVIRWNVSVFRDDAEGRRGFTAVTLSPAMEEEEIRTRLKEAYFAASFAMNPGYDMPEPVQAAAQVPDSLLLRQPLADSAGQAAAALFAGDDHESAFVGSAEIFVIRSEKRVVSSEGTDVSWIRGEVKGEFVAQCKQPEDVEIYQDFAYDSLSGEALTALVRETLSFAADRARAQKVLKSGTFDLVLSGASVGEVLNFYWGRSSAGMIYPGYSRWEKETAVQKADEGYEALNLTLLATEPFSAEGIPMTDRVLLEEGVLKTIHGGNRFCRYLQTEPTGEYRKLRCDNAGSRSLAEIKQAPCLWAVTFSDFQMDEMSGYFGGEIRLAYLIEDGKMTPVTGGSVSGSILETGSRLLFSKERYESAFYSGPAAMRIHGCSVAGTD